MLGEGALRAILREESTPAPDAWVALPADEDQGRQFAEVYLLVGRALYRIRASPERRSEGAHSQCGCDRFPLKDDATFYLEVAYSSGNTAMPTTVIDWSFDLADGLGRLKIKTNDQLQAAGPRRELEFARALAAAVNQAH